MSSQRIPILFDPWYAGLSSALGLFPSRSYVDVSNDAVRVRMGWAFRSTFPRRAVASTEILEDRPISRGVHGFAGRWLVNGSGERILQINLFPAQRAYVLGFPIRLKQLMVSVPDPRALATILGASDRGSSPRNLRASSRDA